MNMYEFVDKWPIFSILDPKVLASVRKLCVFGNSANEAIIVTENEEVYALGSNCSGCLGLGDGHNSFEPRKISTLCKKSLIDIAYGSGPHVLALTSTGDVYSWGHNGYSQLGNGNSNQGFTPTQIETHIGCKKVVGVACGSHHSMVLTDTGEVYSWGQNNCGQVGSGTNTNQSVPRKITTFPNTRKTIAIACGQTSSMALLDNGELYGWGYNGNGQLGLGNNVNQLNPFKVQSLSGIVIIQVVCGYAHTLAMSDNGELYSWGSNSYGQLGTGNKANLVFPHKIMAEERFVEVAATHYSHISVAMTQKGQVYIWGQCRGQSITSLMPTRFLTTDDAFASFAAPAVTWRLYSVDEVKGSKIIEDLSGAYNDEETSDVKFCINGQYIYVHRSILKIRCEHFRRMFQSHWSEANQESILKIRCEHFRRMFQSHWSEANQDTIEVSDYSFSVYSAFLQYLYTDTVNLQPEDAIGLLDLANAYFEPSLKQKCQRMIQQGICIENSLMLYSAAIKFDAKELEEFCFNFSLKHLTAVTQTDAFNSLDATILKDFFRRAAVAGAFKN